MGFSMDVIMRINKLRVFFVKSLREKVNLHPCRNHASLRRDFSGRKDMLVNFLRNIGI